MTRMTGVFWVKGFGDSIVKAVVLEFARHGDDCIEAAAEGKQRY